MNYSHTQYEEMAMKFNLLGFTGKLLLIKNHSDIFYLEEDNGWFMLRLKDDNAMDNEYDMLFNFPNELSSSDIRELFKLIDIQLK